MATRPLLPGLPWASREAQILKTESPRRVMFCGIVKVDEKNGRILVEQRSPSALVITRYLEPNQPLRTERLLELYDEELNSIEVARHPSRWSGSPAAAARPRHLVADC